MIPELRKVMIFCLDHRGKMAGGLLVIVCVKKDGPVAVLHPHLAVPTRFTAGKTYTMNPLCGL